MWRKKDPLKDLVGRRVVLHTAGDKSIDGVLAAVHKDFLLLDAPKALDEAPDEILPGRAGALRLNIDWFQVP